jgi:preprotein translocase subunit SecG
VIYLLYTVHVLVCVFLILVVLLQHGKGADFSVFGGGSTQTAFGSRGATTFLHKLTVASFVIFVLTTLFIGQLGSGPSVLRGARRGKASATKPVVPPSPSSRAAVPLGKPIAAPAAVPSAAPKPPVAGGAPPSPASSPTPVSGTPPPKPPVPGSQR